MLARKYKQLGKNTVLVFLGGVSSKLVGFIMLPLYTRWLSVEEYGLADVLTVYATLLVGVVACCVYDAVFVLPKGASQEEQKQYISTALSFITISAVGVGVLFYILHSTLSISGVRNAFLDNLSLIFVLVTSEMFFKVIQQFCRSIDKITIFSFSGAVVTVLTAILSILLIPRYGVNGYVYSMAVSYILGAVFALVLSGGINYISYNNIRAGKCKEMLKYSVPLIPNAIMWWIVDAINRPLMEQYVGLEGIGLYAIASKFPGLLSLINAGFITSWQISVLDEFGKEGYSAFYNKIFRIVVLLLSSVLIIITLGSKLFIELFSTPQYYAAWKFIPYLTFGVLLSNVAGFVGCNFSATRESKYYFYSSVWAAVCALILNILFIPIYGVWGAVMSSLLSFVVMAGSRICYSWKYVKITSVSVYFLLFFVDLLLMTLFIAEVKWIWIASTVIVAIIVHVNSLRSLGLRHILSFLK